jgi:hypothetical protein
MANVINAILVFTLFTPFFVLFFCFSPASPEVSHSQDLLLPVPNDSLITPFSYSISAPNWRC